MSYTVKKDDTLSQIAKAKGTTVAELVKLNEIIDPNFITTGQVLNLPSDKVDTNSTTLWGDTLNDTMQKLLSGEKFSYDFNEDALYQQYKDKYIKQGKLAMADTIGQASAMTGGYGNSYAQSVGQQAYQASLENLNDIVPELYQMAYDRYNSDRQDLYNQYAMLSAQEEQNYSKWIDERNYNYGVERDTIADQQWQTEFDEAKRQYDEQMAFAKQQYEDSKVSDIISNSGGKITVDEDVNYKVVEGAGTTNISSIPSSIINTAKNSKTNAALESYLDGLEENDEITPEQSDYLYEQYRKSTKDLDKRNWTLGQQKGDDGGFNWFFGIDEDAVVVDEYGNRYRLDKLKDELISNGMSEKEAKKYVKDLQKKVGAVGW